MPTTISAPGRAEAAATAAAEYAALLAMLRRLPPEGWAAPTECPPWTVREMVAHVNGAAEEAVRRRVMLRHYATALRARGRPLVDVVNDQQIADRAGHSPADLLAELGRLAGSAPRARARVPGVVRRLPLPASSGARRGDTVGYLLDVIYARDVWMHRVDIARAAGRPLPHSGADEQVVDQVVRDVQRAWRAGAVLLSLTGHVNGSWPLGEGTPRGEVSLDTVAACRLWSGRSDETEPGGGAAPSTVRELLGVRVLF